MIPQMDRNQYNIIAKDVHLSSPSLDALVATGTQC